MDIEQIFPGGEWKNDNEYVCRCPICNDHRYHNHCHINPEKGVFHCFYCGEGGSLSYLLKEFADIRVEIDLPRKEIQKKQKYPETDFWKFSKITGLSGTLDRLALSYMKRRGFDRKICEDYDIRFGDSGRYYGRIIVPIFENGRVVCFSARSFLKIILPKYLFPYHGETLIAKSEAVFGYDLVKDNFKSDGFGVIITEGIFDAIRANIFDYPGLRAVSILGKKLSKGQLFKLLKLPKNLIYFVMMDADAGRDGLEIAKTLCNYGRTSRLCRLKKGDPDSVPRSEFVRAIEESKEFSFDLELEITVMGENS